MRRSFFLTVLAVLLAGVAWWLTDTLTPPPEPTSATPVEGSGPAPVAEPVSAARTETGNGTDGADDAEVRAALNGFVGRVVDADRRPVASCGVRLYRGALDDAGQDALAGFAEPRDDAQRCLAGEARTNADGTFRIDGVWPRGLYLLLAGLGTEAPAHRLLTHAAAPGELVDLGDIVLEATASVTGIVVDERGAPVADATVRGVDLPAGLLAEYPFEQVDPDGALLLRWPDAPMRVFEIAAAAKALLAQLPIPTTRTDRDGVFRLLGLAPGKSTIAATKPGHLSAVAGDVPLQPRQVHALGRMELRRGEELIGRVVDARGQPVVGAEVLAGSTQITWPVDPLRRLGATDAEGRFRASGFAAGNVTIAARRSARDPWFVAAPQPVRGDLVVALPASFALTLRVTGAAGGVVRQPQLRVLAGRNNGAGTLHQALGATPLLDLAGRRTDLPDGRVRIADLPSGDYVVFAAARAEAPASVEVVLTADTEATLELAASNEYRVRVVGPEDLPIRGAAIYVEGREQGRDRTFGAGRTDADGLLATRTSSEEAMVSADHPRWGRVHGRTTAGAGELLLRMQPPGRLEGTLLEHGQPPPSTCAIRVLHLPDVRGPIRPLPVLVAPRHDGAFALPALQPGRYEVSVVRAPAQATSAGAMLALWLSLSEPEASPQRIVEVLAGETVRLGLDLSDLGNGAPGAPTAHLFGTVQQDGRPAAGFPVALQAGNALRTTEVDAAGRFDFGPVPAGEVTVRVLAPGVTLLPRRELGTRQLRLQAGEEQALEFAIAFVALDGTVVRGDGSPVEGATVIASARGIFHQTATGPDGAFAFASLPAGVYRFDVHHVDGLRGALVDVHTDGEAHVSDLRIVLHAVTRVAGRIDTSVFGRRAEHIGLSFLADDQARPEGMRLVAWAVAQGDGTFATDDLVPGTYRLRVHARLDAWQEYEATAPIEVPAQGVRDLDIRLAPRSPSPDARR